MQAGQLVDNFDSGYTGRVVTRGMISAGSEESLCAKSSLYEMRSPMFTSQ